MIGIMHVLGSSEYFYIVIIMYGLKAAHRKVLSCSAKDRKWRNFRRIPLLNYNNRKANPSAIDIFRALLKKLLNNCSMPIKSYLAQAFDGKKRALERALANLPSCEHYAAENEDIIVLITDTSDEEEEKRLQDALNNIPELKNLSLVSGFMSNQE